MTRYLQALKRLDGRYDYTSSTGSSSPYPLGYCAGWRDVPADAEKEQLRKKFGAWFLEDLEADIESRRPYAHKYHTDGHATEAEAHACYRTYELDNHLELRGPPEDPGALHKCKSEGCPEYTAGMAMLGEYRWFYLCDKHRNRDEVEKLV